MYTTAYSLQANLDLKTYRSTVIDVITTKVRQFSLLVLVIREFLLSHFESSIEKVVWWV